MRKGTKNPAPVDKPTEEEVKAQSEIWSIVKPVAWSALELESVSGTVYQKAYNAIYDKRAFFQPGRYKFSGQLLKESLEELLKKKLDLLSEEQAKLSSQSLVEHFGRTWKKWSDSIILVTGLFMYVENVVPDFNVRLIMQNMWKQQLFSNECKGNIVTVACDIIDEHRKEMPVSLDLVRSLINSLASMDKAEQDFELMKAKKKQPGVFVPRRPKPQTASNTLLQQLAQEVLERTRRFYRKESERLVQMTPAAAIKFVNDVCRKENELNSMYLMELKMKNIDSVLNETLVTDNLSFFLKGFQAIVVSDDKELGKAIFTIFKRVNKLQVLAANYAETVKQHILDEFEKNLEAASKDCRKYIEVAASEYNRFKIFGKACFGENVEFSKSLEESMTSALNDNAVIRKNIPPGGANVELSKNMFAARVFAQYIHLLMIPSKDHLGEKEREETEAVFIDLYRFLKSKKDFLDQYKNGLARRLLRHEYISIPTEDSFLDKMKKVKGEDILIQCTNMISDVKKVEDKGFAEFLKGRGVSKCPVEPLLCSSSWPIKTTNHTLQLPENLQVYVRYFKQYFDSTNNKNGEKSLCLMHQYGRADISFRSGGKWNELNGTEIHLVILPMIKLTGVISFKQIMEATKLTLEDLKSQLAYLITNGFILAKNEEGQTKLDRKDRDTWFEGTLMKANGKFSHPKGQTKFTIAVRKDERSSEAAAVTKEEIKAAFEGYKMTCEANIVRIMKTRKDFSVNDLFSETVKAVNRWFSLDRKVFTAALSDLVDQEIISRESVQGPNGRTENKLKYIA